MSETEAQGAGMPNVIQRSGITRTLHWLIAIGVIAQLGLSLVMQKPGKGGPGDALFELHEKVGIATLALLVAFWVWSMVRSGETRLAALFPWFSPHRVRLVLADTRHLLKPRAAGAGERPLASAVHGLGLLVATVMAASGLIGYFITPARWALGVHESIAPLMWAYLVGHVAMSMVHEARSDHVLRAMLGFHKAGSDAPGEPRRRT